MTVEQLIAILQKMPQEKIVQIEIIHPGWHEIHSIKRVENFDDKYVRLAWIY